MPPMRNVAKPRSRVNRGTTGARVAVHELPASGCDLPVPDLPGGRDWSDAEKARWVELWQSPQATQWDESVAGMVALLVTYESQIFAGAGAAWVAQEARHALEALGLTPRSMSALGWRIVDGA